MHTLQIVRRVGNHHPAPASAPHGGQASGPGLFGLGTIGGDRRRPAVATVRFQHIPATTRRAPLPPTRVRGALSPHSSDGLTPAAYQKHVAAGARNYFRAAADSTRRDEREWRELADLAAQPEWDRVALYGGAGSMELQLAED